MLLTNEQAEFLRANDTPLKHAFFSDYVHTIPNEIFTKYVEIYRALGHRENVTNGCGACVLAMCRTLYVAMVDYTPADFKVESKRGRKPKNSQR